MRINYNVSAAIANKHLLGIENDLSTTMERLSSGFKINHSKDSPSGMAISNKMQAQIDALNRASKNGSDGISVIHIADGALDETTNVLQRMRELSVQAANDATLTQEDKDAIQQEIDELKKEVDRISRDTEFNARTLLDGSFDTRVYSDRATRVYVSDQVEPGNYKLSVTSQAKKTDPLNADAAGVAGGFNSTDKLGGPLNPSALDEEDKKKATMSINGSEVEINADDTYEEVFAKIRDAAEIGNVTVERDATTGALTFISKDFGSKSVVKIAFSSQELADKIGMTDPKQDPNNVFGLHPDTENPGWVLYGVQDAATGEISYPTGEDIKISMGDPAKAPSAVTLKGDITANDNRLYQDDAAVLAQLKADNPGDVALAAMTTLTDVRNDPTLNALYAADIIALETTWAPAGISGSITINGHTITLDNKSRNKIASDINNALSGSEGINVSKTSITPTRTGADQKLEISFSSQTVADFFGPEAANGYSLMQDQNGTWVYAKPDPDYTDGRVVYPTGKDADSGFTSSATAVTDGNRGTITDIGGVKFSFMADPGFDEISFEVTDMGRMTIHIGANMDQNMQIRIPEVSCETLYIDDLDVRTVGGADRAIEKLDSAISFTSEVRSRLGAYENRLDYSVKSLDTFEENMTNAISRLTDADMAEEMTNYTHQNVLNQAAISVLTQANELPQQVLQILQ